MDCRLPVRAHFGKAGPMMRTILIIALAGTVSACDGLGGAEPRNTSPVETESASATAVAAEATAKAHGNGARAVSEETDDFLFKYSYPAVAGRIPELAELLDERLDRQRATLSAEGQEARENARQEGFPYNKHSYTAEWKRIADLPGWLSLSVDISTYSGGAHGMYGVESLVWDKETKRAMKTIDLSASPSALAEAYGDRFSKGLDSDGGRRRGTAVPEGSGELFDECRGSDELEVLARASNGRSFNPLPF